MEVTQVKSTSSNGSTDLERKLGSLEWERKMSSLDKQEREVHQSQLRLIRDHTLAFVRDLAHLKTEVANQKLTLQQLEANSSSDKSRWEAAQKKHIQVVDQQMGELEQKQRLMATQDKLSSVKDQLEQSFQESLQKVQQSFEEKLQRRLDSVQAQVQRFEQSMSELHEPLSALRPLLQLDLDQSLQKHRERHSELQGQLETMKLSLQDLSDGHAQLRESHSAHSSCLTELRDKHQEAQRGHQEHRQDAETRFAQVDAEIRSAHEALREVSQRAEQEQKAGLEQCLAQVHEVHGQMQSAHEDHRADLEQRLSQVHEAHGQMKSTHEEHCAELEQRLSQVHEAHGQMKSVHEEHRADLEQRLSQVHDAHGQMKAAHEDLGLRLAGLHTAHQEQVLAGQQALGALQEATTNELQQHSLQLRSHYSKWEAHRASLEERLENIEGVMMEFCEKQSNELEIAQRSLSEVQLEQQTWHREKESWRVLAERLQALESLLGTPRRSEERTPKKVSYYVSVFDRFGELETRLGEVFEEQSRIWSALDGHTHDLSSHTLRKVNSRETSPSCRAVWSNGAPRAQTAAPAVPSTPMSAALRHPGQQSPLSAQQVVVQVAHTSPQGHAPQVAPKAQFAKPVLPVVTRSPSMPARPGAMSSTASLASVGSVATAASAPFPWPASFQVQVDEEVERISCGPARYLHPN
ncbi:unnamed protein product [Effrenium voratum]|nr:unnamed protein product [Effrenium voratum]